MDQPAVAGKRLEHRVEVHRGEPWRVDGGESCRDTDRPAEGHAQVGEVPTRSSSGQQGVLGRIVDRARPGHVVDAATDPPCDGGDPRVDVLPDPELGDGETDQMIARAVPTGPEERMALVVAAASGRDASRHGEPGPVPSRTLAR